MLATTGQPGQQRRPAPPQARAQCQAIPDSNSGQLCSPATTARPAARAAGAGAGGSTPASVGSTMPAAATSPISLLSQGVPFEMRPIAARNRHSPGRALCSELPPAAWYIAAPAWHIAPQAMGLRSYQLVQLRWHRLRIQYAQHSSRHRPAGAAAIDGCRGSSCPCPCPCPSASASASALPAAVAVSLPGTWPAVTTIGRT